MGMGLGVKVVLLMDGCFSGVFCGLLIGYVFSEVVEGGLLVFVEDGDYIVIDIEDCLMNV